MDLLRNLYKSTQYQPTPIPIFPEETMKVLTQDKLIKELRNPVERKPDAYKSINSSQVMRVMN
jgi:hypothetical protein